MTLTDYSITWRHATGSRKWVARVCFERGDSQKICEVATEFTKKAEAEAFVLHKIPEMRENAWRPSNCYHCF